MIFIGSECLQETGYVDGNRLVMVTTMDGAGQPSISAGLIGYGYAGKTFHAPLVTATEGLSLTAVASSRAVDVLNNYPGVSVDDEPARVIARDDIDLVVISHTQ